MKVPVSGFFQIPCRSSERCVRAPRNVATLCISEDSSCLLHRPLILNSQFKISIATKKRANKFGRVCWAFLFRKCHSA